MKSAELIRDFTDWIKDHTQIESFFVNDEGSDIIFYAVTSEKNTLLYNAMIFTEYDYISYCKLNNVAKHLHLEIEFFSGNKAVIELISSVFEPDSKIKELFSR